MKTPIFKPSTPLWQRILGVIVILAYAAFGIACGVSMFDLVMEALGKP